MTLVRWQPGTPIRGVDRPPLPEQPTEGDPGAAFRKRILKCPLVSLPNLPRSPANVLRQIVKPCLHETASRAPQDRFPLPTVQPLGLPQIRFDPGEVSPDCGPGVLQPFDVHDRTPFPAPLQRLERIVLVGFVFAGAADPGGFLGRLGSAIGAGFTS